MSLIRHFIRTLPILIAAAIPGSAQNLEPKISVERDPVHSGHYNINIETPAGRAGLFEDSLEWIRDPIPSFVDNLVNLPEDKIDVGKIALRLARQFEPQLNVDNYSAKIDEMVNQIRALTKGSKDPEVRISAINRYLYDNLKISYDFDDPKAQKLKNRFLNGLIDTRKGSCITMPILYLAIAQRLGYPIYPVLAPRHLFLRYVDPNLEFQNIEPTSGGAHIPEDEYRLIAPTSEKGAAVGSYFRTLTYREFLGELIAENAYHWGSETGGDLRRSVKYLHYAMIMNHPNPAAHRLMAKAYENFSQFGPPEFRPIYQAHVKYHSMAAEDQGLSWTEARDNYIAENAAKLSFYRQLKRTLSHSGVSR